MCVFLCVFLRVDRSLAHQRTCDGSHGDVQNGCGGYGKGMEGTEICRGYGKGTEGMEICGGYGDLVDGGWCSNAE